MLIDATEEGYETVEGEFMSEEEIEEEKNFHPRQGDKLCIIGSDMTSLYPSCDAVETSRIIYRAAMETPIQLEGFDNGLALLEMLV